MTLRKLNTVSGGRVLFAHWANNAGRGRDNCTLTLCRAGVERPAYTRGFAGADVLASVRVSSWRGDVNLTRAACVVLGICKSEIGVALV